MRRQLLPDAAVDELGWAVYGRTPFASWVPGVLVDTFNRITGPGEVGMSVATYRALEPVASAAARLAPSVHLTDIPGYFSWTLPLTDPRLFQADAASLHHSAAALVEGWHPARHVTRPRRWANIALKDAQMLLRALQRVMSGTTSMASAVHGYQAGMLEHGFRAVADSRDNPFMRMARRQHEH